MLASTASALVTSSLAALAASAPLLLVLLAAVARSASEVKVLDCTSVGPTGEATAGGPSLLGAPSVVTAGRASAREAELLG